MGRDFFNDLHNIYKNTFYEMMEVMLRKKEFEENLDGMWKIYASGNVAQIRAYNKQVEIIKKTGLKVLRNQKGKHKIVHKDDV